ncbi:hypothetical protein ALI22I_32680 [Saccharothrix sp. ALI-22-I]|uniref:glycosyltransferase family 2 protein n=1 Tax=Saccharothrix sp. ALI-22-I TaxID=1933778 RepID=UPI00097C04BC|nr:glycosyltransferase family 2 protein [Saccharothrix sp. ALI-22-I]ONI83295.1 hypothetical protein ALI22I_32680 [Saccharothrix sp. ALI-22-I]
MKVVGVAMVRDEDDVLATTLGHHLSIGVDEVLVVDNGSSDGTGRILRGMSRSTGRVHWTRDDGEFRQSEVTTALAREAVDRGADWIVVIDADEFWHVDGDLRTRLAASRADVLQCPVVNFVQERGRRRNASQGLLRMNHRVERAVGPVDRTVELVTSRQIGFIEMQYPPKCISRAVSTIEVHPGNHGVSGLEGPQERVEDIACLHAPLRSRADLERKAEQGVRVAQSPAFRPDQGWHVRRWRDLVVDGDLDAEWAANSYDEAGSLDVFGLAKPLVRDERLANIARRVGV